MSKPYSSIETVWVRDKVTNVLNFGEIREPINDLVSSWMVTEKIDGTNIRAIYRYAPESSADPEGYWTWQGPIIMGRSDAATMNLQWVQDFKACLPDADRVYEYFELASKDHDPGPDSGWEVTFYGEGYGPKIQKHGAKYSPIRRFRCFDVKVRNTWMDFADYRGICASLGIPVVPLLGMVGDGNFPLPEMPETLDDLREMYPAGSVVAEEDGGDDDCPVEGIVAVPRINLYDSRGNRLMWKLTEREFDKKPLGRTSLPSELLA